MKKLLSIILDTAWGPATALVCSAVLFWAVLAIAARIQLLAGPATGTPLHIVPIACFFLFGALPCFLCFLLLPVAFIRALWKRHWKRAIAQAFLAGVAFCTVFIANHLLFILAMPPSSTP